MTAFLRLLGKTITATLRRAARDFVWMFGAIVRFYGFRPNWEIRDSYILNGNCVRVEEDFRLWTRLDPRGRHMRQVITHSVGRAKE